MRTILTARFYQYSWSSTDWRSLGFKTIEDVEYWKTSSCGIQCLKMAIDGLHSTETLSLAEYIQKGIELGAYTHEYGWIHIGLAKIAKQMELFAVAQERLTVENIKDYIQKGYFIIISIKPNFEVTKSFKERMLFWKKYGGHMALVVGYTSEPQEGFLVHHTSKRPEYDGPNIFIPIKQFTKAFTGRGVVVGKNEL